MKTQFLLLTVCLLSSYVITATPTIAKANYCVSLTDANVCTGCYYKESKQGARLMTGSGTTAATCTTARTTKVANCMYYTNTDTSQTLSETNTCTGCKSGYVLVQTYNSTTWTSTVCTKASDSLKEITNCADGLTVSRTNGTLTKSACNVCKSGYTPSTVDTSA